MQAMVPARLAIETVRLLSLYSYPKPVIFEALGDLFMVTTVAILGEPSIQQARMYKQADTIVKPAQLNRSYHVDVKSKNTMIAVGQDIHTVIFRDGNLFINDIHIVRPRFANDFVSWKQLTQSHYTCGHLRFLPGGDILQGLITLGTTKADAIAYSVLASYPLSSDETESKLLPTATATGMLRTSTSQITGLTLLTRADLLQDTSLSADELAGLVTGTGTIQTDINTTANSMLIENMKWAISQRSDEKDWLNLFYGQQEEPPVLSPERVTLINKSLGWYQDTYAKAQLGWQAANYAGTNKPATQLTHYQTLQLKYFLQTGIAQDPNFITQQQGLYPEAYAETFPRIRAYLADGGEKWANELMNQIYLPNLGLEVATVQLTNDMSSVNANCTLLTVLQPSGELARQYYQNFLTATLQSNVDTVSLKDSTTLMQWLPLWLQEFLIQATTLPETIPDSAKLAIAQLNEMMGEMGGDATKVAQEMVTILVNAPGSTIWDACKGAEDAWATKFPKLSAVGRIFFFAAFSYGLSSIIQAFGNWKNLSDEDRAKLVTATVGLGVDGLLIVPEMLISVKDMGTDILSKINAWRYSSKTQEGIDQIGKAVDENYLENGLNETSKLFNAETKAIEAEGSLWQKVFGDVVKPVLKVAGVVVAAIIAAFSVYDLIQEIRSGQPITKIVLDAIIAATNIAIVVCLVVEIALASTIASVFGVVFALIGIIISLIEMCVIKPTDPLDDFMKNVVVPFVDALPPQTSPSIQVS